METSTMIILAILILAILFFGYTILKSNNSGSGSSGYSSYQSPSLIGGGCGR